MKKNILTLAKEMDCKTEREYFDYLIECHIYGNFDSCKRLFAEMRRNDQKTFIMYISDVAELKGVRNFYFALL